MKLDSGRDGGASAGMIENVELVRSVVSEK
jgi:hypothetical protein